MSKVLEKRQNKLDISSIVFLIGMSVVTIVFLTIMIISIVRPNVIKKINKIEEISLSEYDKLGSEKNPEYIIFVYSSKKNENYNYSTYRNELVLEAVLDYASYVKENGGIKIYRLDLSKDENKGAITELKLTDASNVPAILKMKFDTEVSKINTTKKTPADINDYLKSLIK